MALDELSYIKSEIQKSIDLKKTILEDSNFINQILAAVKICTQCFNTGGKVLFAGNGGSAADAQHLAAEFVTRFYFERPALSALSLSTDTSVITAASNDYGYDFLFSRQVQAHGRKGDVFVGLSTSGKSPNINRAFQEAKKLGLHTIGFCGKNGFPENPSVDLALCVPSLETPRIQECHITIGHILCALVEETIFKSKL